MDSRKLRNEYIKRRLMRHHRFFNSFIKFSQPIFTQSLATAGIGFDLKSFNPIIFYFNPEFFDALSDIQLEFVYMHEMLHVLGNHGLRGKDFNSSAKNVAADIVINEFILEHFGFDKTEVLKIDNVCGAITCLYEKYFTEEDFNSGRVLKDMHFEYYYELLKDREDLKNLDDHSQLGELSQETLDSLKKILRDSNSEELKELKTQLEKLTGKKVSGGQQAGEEQSPVIRIIETFLVRPDKRFETIFKQTVKVIKDKYEHEWRRKNPLLASFNRTSGIRIPNEMRQDWEIKDKIDLVIFLDTSGSVNELAPRFFRLVDSIPKENFTVRVYGFHTSVYEIDMKERKIQSGGTRFDIIENKLQELEKYPRQILVVTDGWGTTLNPAYPERFTVFLTENNLSCFPTAEKMKIIMLDNYEEGTLN